jgi:hypothetical protein
MSDHAVFLIILGACCCGAVLAVVFLVAAVHVSAREAEQEDGRWR